MLSLKLVRDSLQKEGPAVKVVLVHKTYSGSWGKHAAMAMSPNLLYETWCFLSHYVDEAEHKQANKRIYKPA